MEQSWVSLPTPLPLAGCKQSPSHQWHRKWAFGVSNSVFMVHVPWLPKGVSHLDSRTLAPSVPTWYHCPRKKRGASGQWLPLSVIKLPPSRCERPVRDWIVIRAEGHRTNGCGRRRSVVRRSGSVRRPRQEETWMLPAGVVSTCRFLAEKFAFDETRRLGHLGR
jgi:hypothetical protein